ncbi:MULTISPECIES: cellulose biosynthesis protein BcsF [Erwinia]|uniref:cellulose biosynthesis protein BcsF n=1 Tax=Erwinia TaxID=551 RepID=UPI00105C3D6B|nr:MULTISPECIES: cellulose biosynthesis protein BcsF [Erwinia]MBP2153490.1 cellulose biosynthesis operon protein BcsF/YhjT [Erwinia rhapontici]MCS3608559.1 cellulose biosynthesis operon protein BcsF/YhjT [Erwinia rhapontici]NKG31140.1 cellulose biosynthesis protein BcsF [Erwinia rhapontici]NNS08793.1 cellulose biosynthesis protein BcsF [Erwinia sp. JH02]TDS98847.1 cellulose biosynthesis operon protein BcsF/YhjT [Erwinia rhapontici]
MTLMDGVQIVILLLLILLLLKPFYSRWLPKKWRGILHRVLPPRALKYEGTWRRKSPDSETKKR